MWILCECVYSIGRMGTGKGDPGGSDQSNVKRWRAMEVNVFLISKRKWGSPN